MMKMFKKLKKYGWVIGLLKDADKEDRSNIIDGYKNRKQYYTSPRENFEADLKEMAKCANCPNMCRFDCPALLVPKVESFAPANKARISLLAGMNHLPMDDPTVIDTMYACMNCDACYEWCPMSISTGELLTQMRAELEKRDLIPERLHKLKETIESNGSVFEESPFKKAAEESPELDNNDSDPEVFYYVGCVDLKYREDSVRATMALLKELNIPFATNLKSRECCAGPVNKVGYRSVAKKVAARNVDVIKDSGADIVLTTCPGCLEALKVTYEEDLDAKIKRTDIIHAIDFFKKKIDEGELKLSNDVNKSISYHDPCILSRTSSDVRNLDATHQLLKSLPGLEVHFPYLSGKETRCCGMGGGYHVSNPEYSKQEGLERLSQLQKTKADYMVSGCPSCEFSIMEALENQKSLQEEKSEGKQENNVLDIVELIAEAAGVNY